jgi:hypothetical protein
MSGNQPDGPGGVHRLRQSTIGNVWIDDFQALGSSCPQMGAADIEGQVCQGPSGKRKGGGR